MKLPKTYDDGINKGFAALRTALNKITALQSQLAVAEAARDEAVKAEREACAKTLYDVPDGIDHEVTVPSHFDLTSMGREYKIESYTYRTKRRPTREDFIAAIRARSIKKVLED